MLNNLTHSLRANYLLLFIRKVTKWFAMLNYLNKLEVTQLLTHSGS